VTPKFATVILDVDSTLSGIEGIDWLAARRGPAMADRVARLTAAAMTGERLLNDVYGARLDLVRPTAREVADLAEAYAAAVAPGAPEMVRRMSEAGVRIEVVTSGIQQAVEPFIVGMGIGAERLHAVRLEFDADGDYLAFDATSPLVVHGGKRIVAESLKLRQPILAVGDGVTDAEIRPAAAAFAVFTGFVRRDPIVEIADHEVKSFSELEALVLGSSENA
jgi:phosphoserine phosphatase